MKKLLVLSLLIPSAVFAQQDSMLVVNGGQMRDARPASEIEHERVMNQFPDWAVTRVGSATGGYDKDVTTPPAAPVAPASPGAEAIPPSPQAPAAPAAPANAITKLWPADTVPIFMQSCVGYQPKLVVPCNCVITNLMLEMPHDEFLRLTAQNTIEDDIRLKNIRVKCAVKAAAEQ